MAFSFEPMKFIRSAAELSNVISSDSNAAHGETSSISENEHKSVEALKGNEAHSFYLSLLSSNHDPTQAVSDSASTSEEFQYRKERFISRSLSTLDEKGKRKLKAERKGIKSTKTGHKIVSTEIVRNRFLKAASNGDLLEVKKCLRDWPSVLNSVDEFGWSALMCACYEGHADVVEFLLCSGADFSLENRRRRTAMNIARRRGHRDIAALLASAKSGELFEESRSNSPSMDETESREESYCDVCSMTSKDPNHETSTIHLLNTATSSDAGEEPDQRPSYLLPESNKGFQLMLKEGWDRRRGLGRHGQGRWYPVKTILKRDRLGLGSRSGPKPRVTHFAAHDPRAIEKNGETDRKLKLKSQNMNKKERLRKEAKEKEWIRNFRREFY